MDIVARKHFILGSAWYTIPAPLAVVAASWALLPPFEGDRYVLAARWLAVATLPYVAVCLWIAFARFREGSHDPTKGAESERLRIHCRVMQNTLEQLVWFAVTLFALVTFLTPAQARIVPVLCGFFAAARFLYWWGYLRHGTLGRAPAVQLTLSLNVHMLGLALGLLVWSLLHPS